MAESTKQVSILNKEHGPPRLERSYFYTFLGDWGMANFHRICGWLSQEFGDRTGPATRTAIRSFRSGTGGIEVLQAVEEGEAHLTVATPAKIMTKALTGDTPFTQPMPHLRALAVLPQTDRMVLAIHPKYGIKTYDDLRRIKPKLKITTGANDGTNFIGYVADKFLEAHGLPVKELESWGCEFLRFHRPDGCINAVEAGTADAILQEAIMGPWWENLIENDKVVPIPAEAEALNKCQEWLNLGPVKMPAGYWSKLKEDLPALDFADFVIIVRDDLPEEVAYMLTLILIEARGAIEAQYKHVPPNRSGLSYPLEPVKMADTPLPLHPGAERYYREAGILK